MALTQSALPAEGPDFLRKLYLYLLGRDYRAPSALPQPRAIITTALVTAGLVVFECDRLSWAYEQPKLGRGTPADGFIIWCNQGETVTFPRCGGWKLSIDTRQFDMVWPDGIARSYAVAAYRNTYQGEQATALVFDESWQNVT